jgi:hypothetical protein
LGHVEVVWYGHFTHVALLFAYFGKDENNGPTKDAQNECF